MKSKNSAREVKLFFVALFLSHICRAEEAIPIFEDNFDSGGMASFWTGNVYVTITDDLPKDGSHSSKWLFPGVPIDVDGWAEARFDLGREYYELSIMFDWYIPAHYFHRDSPGGDNNKLLRLWAKSYDDLEKIGASTYNQGSSGDSQVGEDYRIQATWGQSTNITNRQDFITEADHGKWMGLGIYIKSATDTSPAIMRIYKNGQLFHEADKITNNHLPGAQGYRYGYLLGWANSGFDIETIFYMDNVKFYDQDVFPLRSSAPSVPLDVTIVQ
jgi:hypothetical protein